VGKTVHTTARNEEAHIRLYFPDEGLVVNTIEIE